MINMNKKGFTLVEALLVIAIIGVLLLTLIPSVITIINKNKEKSCTSTRDSILSSAKMFVAENKYDLNFECGREKTIGLATLKEYGNLNDVELEGFPDVIVTYNCETKKFSYNYENENIVDCKS